MIVRERDFLSNVDRSSAVVQAKYVERHSVAIKADSGKFISSRSKLFCDRIEQLQYLPGAGPITQLSRTTNVRKDARTAQNYSSRLWALAVAGAKLSINIVPTSTQRFSREMSFSFGSSRVALFYACFLMFSAAAGDWVDGWRC